MANKPIKMEKIRQVLLMVQQGISKRKIAKYTGVHRSVIDRYISRCEAFADYPQDLLTLSDEALSGILFQGPFADADLRRQAEFEAFYPYIAQELPRRGVTRQLLHRVYLEKHPDGYRYSQFCDLIQRRQCVTEATMLQPSVAGKVMEIDFAGGRLSWCDPQTGEVFNGEVLLVVLPFSGMTYVEVLRSQKQGDFIEGIQNALRYFGGGSGGGAFIW
jgi:transposase